MLRCARLSLCIVMGRMVSIRQISYTIFMIELQMQIFVMISMLVKYMLDLVLICSNFFDCDMVVCDFYNTLTLISCGFSNVCKYG